MLGRVAMSLGIGLAVLGAYAQTPAPPRGALPAAQGRPEGMLKVKVTEKGTKFPVERVTVEIVGANASQQNAQTNAEGQFQVQLNPGTYRLTLRRQSNRGGNSGIPIVKVVNVERGETKADIEVPPTGEILGRVVDSRGEPLPNARVTLLLRTYEAWSNRAIYQNTPMAAEANDVGEFRVTEVPDGIAFYLYAESVSTTVEPFAEAVTDVAQRRPVNASTFYPSFIEPLGAQAVTLAEGESREGVEIRMVRSQSYCVEDVVTPSPPNANMRYTIQVDVVSVGGGVFNDIGSYRSGRRVFLDPQGRARVCGLWPGTYRFTVQPQNRVAPQRGGDAPPPEVFFGSGEFTITDRDLTRLAVKGSNMFNAAGEVVIDGVPPLTPVQNRLQITMIALTPTATAGSANSAIPGTFVIGNRNIDRYFLRFQGYPPGWYIRNVMYDGEDLNLRVNRFVLDKPSATIRVVLGQNGAKLKVKVVDDKGEPVMGKRVIVIRSGLDEPHRLVGQMLTSYSDSAGECATWTLVLEPARPFLAPGDYKVLATDMPYNQTADVLDQIFAAFQQSGTKVSLTAGGNTEISVKPVELR